ncbi:MAG: M56 family metallopeptidase [Bacteroides sp.]|nr:M56 family metallopeptidase [Bacteroides sp.]
MEEILLHEQTHANQWHSIDVVVSELFAIFFWFNPFVWLTQKEIRNNLEYLADQKVIDSGYDSKKYQYHLLELTQKQVTAPLYNSFKILPLKNRIRMMNKERTRNILRTKYLAIIPLIILLLVISNIETIARSTLHIAKDVIEKAETPNESFPAEEEVITAKTEPGPVVEIIPVNNDAPAPSLVEEEVFMVVEQMPEYPGGTSAPVEFLGKNISYPAEALEAGSEGRVIVQFVVETDGSITETRIVRGIDPYLDQEAIRIVSTMPHWYPGKQRGINVRVKFTLPIQFRISDTNPRT